MVDELERIAKEYERRISEATEKNSRKDIGIALPDEVSRESTENFIVLYSDRRNALQHGLHVLLWRSHCQQALVLFLLSIPRTSCQNYLVQKYSMNQKIKQLLQSQVHIDMGWVDSYLL